MHNCQIFFVIETENGYFVCSYIRNWQNVAFPFEASLISNLKLGSQIRLHIVHSKTCTVSTTSLSSVLFCRYYISSRDTESSEYKEWVPTMIALQTKYCPKNCTKLQREPRVVMVPTAHFVVTGGTGSFRYSNLRCHQQRQSWYQGR